MIHIAVCDDNHEIAECVEELVLNLGKSLRLKLEVSVFFSGEEFCDALIKSDDVFNIVLMDIEMDGITGIIAGRKLRERIENDRTFLIYISSHSKYYKDIIDLNVLCFISKPISIPDFNLKLTQAIDKVLYQRQLAPYPDFSFKKGGKDIYIPIKSIMYLESKQREINLYTTQSKKHVYYGKLNEEEEKLPNDIFCRIHRSFLICFVHITIITPQYVTISDEMLPISEKYRESVNIAYSRFRGS